MVAEIHNQHRSLYAAKDVPFLPAYLQAYHAGRGIDGKLTDALQGHAGTSIADSYGRDAEGMGYSMPVLFRALCEGWRKEGLKRPSRKALPLSHPLPSTARNSHLSGVFNRHPYPKVIFFEKRP